MYIKMGLRAHFFCHLLIIFTSGYWIFFERLLGCRIFTLSKRPFPAPVIASQLTPVFVQVF